MKARGHNVCNGPRAAGRLGLDSRRSPRYGFAQMGTLMPKEGNVAGATIASGTAALILGLLLLNSGVPITGNLILAFQGISLLGALLLALCIFRSAHKAVWMITALGYILAISVVMVLIQYQFGCETAGKCF